MKKIALMGLGTVGSGVEEIISRDFNGTASITGILVQNKSKYTGSGYPSTLLTDNFNELKKQNVDIAISVTGSADEYKHIKYYLNRNIPVITASKAVVSRYHDELLRLSSVNSTAFLYEASVGGGIPVISNLEKLLRTDRIKSIEGILNGTCNYILSRMHEENMDFDSAVREAQQRGFAEADPTEDIMGFDTLRKIVILSNLAFNTRIDEDKVKVIPLKGVSSDDISIFREHHWTLKYCASSVLDKGVLRMEVQPRIYRNTHQYAGINGVDNIISVEGRYSNTLCFSGPGAGKYPTAHSVIDDLNRIINQKETVSSEVKEPAHFEIEENRGSKFYLRAEKSVLNYLSVNILKVMDRSFAGIVDESELDKLSAEVRASAFIARLEGIPQ